MSKMLDALRLLEQAPRAARKPDAVNTVDRAPADLTTMPRSPQRVVSRRDYRSVDPPHDFPQQCTTEVAMTTLERDVIENMQQMQVRQQVLELAGKIEKAADGKSAAMSFHACSCEDSSFSLVLQLAMALAGRCRSTVMVVDADTQTQELSDALQARGESGLTEVLNGAHAWRQVTRSLALPGVALLPAGRGVLAAEGAGTMRLGRLVQLLRDASPFVLVYGGANAGQFMQLRPSNFLESYLMLQLGKSTPSAARIAIDKLQSSEFQISGCVLAGVA